jgi:hypothetical protein
MPVDLPARVAQHVAAHRRRPLFFERVHATDWPALRKLLRAQDIDYVAVPAVRYLPPDQRISVLSNAKLGRENAAQIDADMAGAMLTVMLADESSFELSPGWATEI